MTILAKDAELAKVTKESGAFCIQGKVAVKESGAGVGGLVVHAFDVDMATANQGQAPNAKRITELSFDRSGGFDSLGSVLTAADGTFAIRFATEDFNVSSNELRPEILLLVTRPEDAGDKATTLQERALHVSTPIRYKAGKTESYHIRLRQADLDKYGIRATPASEVADETQSTVLLQQVAQVAAARKALNAGRSELRKTVDKRVEEDFATLSLSAVSATVHASSNYWKPGQNLVEKQAHNADQRLAALATRPFGKRMILRFTEVELRALGLWREGPINGNVPADIVDGAFAASSSAERRMLHACRAEFTEADLDDPPPAIVPTTSPETSPTGEAVIGALINQQLATSTSPEAALRYERVIDPATKNAKVCETVGQLSLCGGPADVTSYHDFPALQIAFEHVWTEIFDRGLVGAGKTLYSEVVKLAEGYTANALPPPSPPAPAPPPSSSPFDPGQAISDAINSFFSGSGGFTPAPSPPGTDMRAFNTVDDLTRLVKEFVPLADQNPYIRGLVQELEERLSSAYKFDVFAPNSINYGVVYTFRQKWEPANYQVGRLVSSLPLAPREVRRYSTKVVTTQSRNDKYLDDREFRGKSEQTATSRAESEIIKRATNNTSFGVNTHASVNMEMFDAGVDTNMSASSERFSQDTKKNFRESVLNAVEEFRRQNKTEVEFSTRTEATAETSGEISNPNDEITVTYLFYELQRQYDISEQLHRVQPVILVANQVPNPDEIDDDWIMANAWILRRVILDESFLAALARITSSSIGDNLALTNLRNSLEKQERLTSSLIGQIEAKNSLVNHLFGVLQSMAIGQDTMDAANDVANMVRGFVDPIGSLLGGLGGGGGETPSFDRVKDMLQMAIERADKENAALASQLSKEQSFLQQLTEKYNKELQAFFDRQTANAQLRMHLKDNILYYMQAIWDYEQPDQRYFRLYDIDIDWFEPEAAPAPIPARLRRSSPGPGGLYEYEVIIVPTIRRTPTAEKRKLVEVADLDKLLGYKGNYMVFPCKEPSYLHKCMMQEFVDNATDGVRDADAYANHTTQELIDYLKCLRRENPAAYASERDTVLALINERLRSPRKESERVVIPTKSMYIEALPGKHPVMEDFKLAHRALDVKRAQADVRGQELENLRFAARLIEGERGDPDVGTRIEVTGNVPVMPVES